MPDQDSGQKQNVGKVIEIKGVVVDAVFTERLPEIYTALRISMAETDGRPSPPVLQTAPQAVPSSRVLPGAPSCNTRLVH